MERWPSRREFFYGSESNGYSLCWGLCCFVLRAVLSVGMIVFLCDWFRLVSPAVTCAGFITKPFFSLFGPALSADLKAAPREPAQNSRIV